MIKRSLYIMAVLLYSAVNVDAMSLKETLASEDIVLNFENGGTIWCEYYNKNGFAPHPGYIKKQAYIYDGNTYYLQLNTIPLFTNTDIEGGGGK